MNREFGSGPTPDRPTGDAAEGSFVGRLLDAIAAEDPDAYTAIMRENRALAEHSIDDAETLRAVHDAIGAKDAGDEQFRKLLAQTEAAMHAPLSGDEMEDLEECGILTRMTRQVPPERAMNLYRKIAPMLAYEVVRLLDLPEPFVSVRRVVDHLCSSTVQDELRRCEHARDGIIEQLSFVLREAGVREMLDRERVLEIIETGGAMGDLVAMENCIRLAGAKAG